MFASKVAVYNDNELVGTSATTATSNFNRRPSLVSRDRQSRRDPRAPTPGAASRRAEIALRRATSPGCSPCRGSTRRRGAKCCCCSTARPRPVTQNVEVEPASRQVHRAGGAVRARRRGAGQRARHAARLWLCDLRRAMTAEAQQMLAPVAAPQAAADWWRGAVVYQIYPRSFADSNGDGIGDLQGIDRAARPCRLAGRATRSGCRPSSLSPMKDFGYDVADYCGVDPIFGTLGDFDALVARAHALGLKVMIDQVYSHTSDEHAWFVESRASRDNRQGRLVRLGRRQARRIAAVELAVGVRRPGVDVGRAARAILPAQFPQGAAAAQRASARRCRRRCWTWRASGSTAGSTASASTRSISRCTTRR